VSLRTWLSRAFSTGVAVSILALSPPSAHADGEFWAIDVSESTRSGVLSASRGELTFGANVTDYGDGVSAGLSLTRRIPFDFGIEGLTLSAGPALGLSGDDLSEVELGLTGSAQRFVVTDWGSYFLQASVGTINRNFFLQAQATFDGPDLTVALSRGGSTEYDETSISISKQLNNGPVSVRAGYRLQAEEVFVGFSVNTF
jgi:hypothetical protein